jgi:fluoride exporter
MPALPALPAFALVFLGGGLGASARYAVNRLTLDPSGAGFPWGTLAVNIVGSLVVGIVAGMFASLDANSAPRLLLITGLIGGFTTFSAFSLETVSLIQRGHPGQALGYVALSVLAALAATATGLWLARG